MRGSTARHRAFSDTVERRRVRQRSRSRIASQPDPYIPLRSFTRIQSDSAHTPLGVMRHSLEPPRATHRSTRRSIAGRRIAHTVCNHTRDV
jgi:hypothetical protein